MIWKKIKFNDSFSNESFLIFRKNKKLYLKKYYKKIDKRLIDSIKKHLIYKKKIRISGVYPVSILAHKIYKKKFVVMPYKKGFSGELIIKNCNIKIINFLKLFYDSYFEKLKKEITWKPVEKKIYEKKLISIEMKIRAKALLPSFYRLSNKIKKKLKKNFFYPYGFCHGDLTLSNMIVDNNKIYLIDFLKTFNDGIAQDIAKIYQEFKFGWSSKYFDKSDSIRTKLFYSSIFSKNYFLRFDKKILNVLNLEIAMSFIRIFPYVKENNIKIQEWLIKCCTYISKNFNKKKLLEL